MSTLTLPPPVTPHTAPAIPRPVRTGAGVGGSLPDLTRQPSRRARPLRPPLPGHGPSAQEQGREELRRVRSLAAVVAVAWVEAEAGRRPMRDLAAWLAPETYDKLDRRIALLERTGTRPEGAVAPRPLGARVCQVSPGCLEASATVLSDGRARAFALRLERRLSRWRVTSIEVG